MAQYVHKIHGWNLDTSPVRFRGDGSGRWLLMPGDGSGERIVSPMSAGSWQNYAGDRKEDVESDRIVLREGAPLPEWAREWVLGKVRRMFRDSRVAFTAAVEDAEWNDPAFRDE